jgi:hypothetical protein
MASIVYAPDGTALDLDQMPQDLAYNGDGTINYIQVTHVSGRIYRQTFTYTSGKVTNISAWVKQ